MYSKLQKIHAHRHTYIVIVFIVGVLFPVFVFAQFGSTKSLGAKIAEPNQIAGKPNKKLQDVVTCAAKDWMRLTPIGNTGMGPGIYFVPFGNNKGPSSISDATKHRHIVGFVKTKVDMNTCFIPGSPTPVPAYELTIYGF